MQVKVEKNLGELFKKAREFGLVYIHTHSDGYYSCRIEFNSVKHTKLEAKSSFHCKTPEQAVQEALDGVKIIIDSFAKMSQKLIA